MGETRKLKHPYGYAAIEIINKRDVSFLVKGVYLYILSKPDGWDFSVARIANDSTDSEYAVGEAVKKLEELGLLKREKLSSGRIVYHIVDPVSESVHSKTKANSPLSQIGTSQNRLVEDISKKELSKKEIISKKEEKFLNKELPRSIGGTEKSRLKNFYTKVYKAKLGGEPKVYLNGKDGGVLNNLLKNYSEWQIAALILEHFRQDDPDLVKACYPISWIGTRSERYRTSIDSEIPWNDPVQIGEYVDESLKNLTRSS